MNGATIKSFSVQTDGEFYGIPVFPASAKNLKAMVVGASGTSGQPMVDVLSANPQRWSRVYALSRARPAGQSPSITHLPADLTWEPEKISALFKENGVQVDYIFFFGYVQIARSDENDSNVFGKAGDLSYANGKLFENFLQALDQASIHPKRIILQTGGKNYGVHQGHVNVPLVEGDPRIELEPNFYYTQEDLLAKYVKAHPGTDYNVTMPQWILSAVANTNMTIFYPLAVYATIQQKLKKPLLYPGDLKSWDNNHPIITGLLLGKFYEWLCLTPETAGESFNITDGSEFTFGRFWPILASWYGLDWSPPREDDDYVEQETAFAPRGYGPKGKLRSSFSFIDWAREPATRQAWSELTQEHKLTADPLQDPEATFTFLQFALELTWSWSTSMNKARKFGWFGYCDSIQSMKSVFAAFEDMRMLPPKAMRR